MKKYFIICLFTLVAPFSNAQTTKQNFDEDWHFAFGNANDPSQDFNYSQALIFAKTGAARGTAIDRNFNDTGWRKLDLPHDWAVELPFVESPNFDVQSHGYKPVGGFYPGTSIGWYRKQFNVSLKDSGQIFRISFDGVFRDASFWINGFYLGNHKSGYTGASFDITDYMDYHQTNVIVVRVDATQYEGWFYEGAGIYRHTWLTKSPPLHFDEFPPYITTNVNGKTAVINFISEIQNEYPTKQSFRFKSHILDREGRIQASTKTEYITLLPGERKSFNRKIILNNPILWDIENPYLYRLSSTLSNNNLKDQQVYRFGIRTIDIRADGVFLNGKYIKVLGTNNHQDHAGVGSAMPDALQYFRIRRLKQMGSNAYRTSHNPPSPELLDACDSLGMLVMDENRYLNGNQHYMDDWKWLLKRDRSRACVFMWSIGNEEGWVQTNSVGRNIASRLIAVQKELDPTRTSTYAADLPNVFNGINEVIPVRGFNYREYAVEAYHTAHPTQPIIGTEMGSTVTTRGIYEKDSVKCYLPDQDITAPWWASKAETWWKLASGKRFWLGGFIWTGFDYRGEPTPFQWPNISSHFGVMDACGFPKNIYYYYKSWWSNKEVIHLSPHWNHTGEEGKPINVWVNSNADTVSLILNGRELGKKKMPKDGHIEWLVNYEAGKLEATGYKNGRRFSNSIQTTGEAFELMVSPAKTTLIADGKDLAVLNIAVLDRAGNIIPTADTKIKFSVTGDAKIIGTGNGDPSSHEKDSYNDTVAYRSAFNGFAQVIVQSGKSVSSIHFAAKADGLWEGATDLQTIMPRTPHPVSKPIKPSKIKIEKMLGADISFLPELEAKGNTFTDTDGRQKDAVEILHLHGFNYVRLRLFNDPSRDSGYSPRQGFCDLRHTIELAKRAKKNGMKVLLDFHYSDYWADPQKQYMPATWRNLDFKTLNDSLYNYTRYVLLSLKNANAIPDMVQVGNEINHGMIWPAGNINQLDSLAELFNSGATAVRSISPNIPVMLHLALGGQNEECRFFIDAMNDRGVQFDVLGLSYYPKWHSTPEDLEYNCDDLARRYEKDIIIVEYSHVKTDVNRIGFNIYGNHGKGTCIWEPLNTWEKLFDENGKANALLSLYDTFSKQYLKEN